MVYKLGALLDSVGHKVKIHKITSATDKERGDIEIRDSRYGRSIHHTTGQFTQTRRSDDAPELHSALQKVV